MDVALSQRKTIYIYQKQSVKCSMKRPIIILSIYLSVFLASCMCQYEKGKYTYIKIHSARSSLFSFSETGIFPFYDKFNRNKLGIFIVPDSTSTRVEYAKNISYGNNLYACEPIDEIIYENSFDSVNVYTVYPFDNEHPAGSKVNNILQHLGNMGETASFDLEATNMTEITLKFTKLPLFDTLRFEITGRIVGGERFRIETEKVTLAD